MSRPDADPADPPELVIGPTSRWGVIDPAEVWRYRELLFFLAWRDVKVRYRQTALGAAWAVLQPVLMMAVFWLFVARIGRVDTGAVPYPVFVFAGLIPWYLFINVVAGAANSLVDSERLISKVYFPRQLIPLAAAGAPLADLCVSQVLLVALMLVTGAPIRPTVVLVPVIVAVILLNAVGVGTLLAALNVSYRDVRYLVPFLLQGWLFGTPSIYLPDGADSPSLPPALRAVMQANPMTGVVSAYRAAVSGGDVPWGPLAAAGGCGAVLFVVGNLYFRRAEDSFADVI